MRILPSIKSGKLVFAREERYLSVSKHGRIVVRDTVENGTPVRLLLVNGTRESATFTTPGLRNMPVFEYIRAIGDILRFHPEIRDTLLIGGAGFSFPKFYISTWPDKSIDVVENNPEMLEIAKRYFFLDALEEEYAPLRNGRMRILIDDGFRYLTSCDKQYDLIINDAFVGRVADKELSGPEGCQAVYDRLRPGGMYLVNAITAREGSGSMPGIMAMEIISRVFPSVTMMPVRADFPAYESQNVLLCATRI